MRTIDTELVFLNHCHIIDFNLQDDHGKAELVALKATTSSHTCKQTTLGAIPLSAISSTSLCDTGATLQNHNSATQSNTKSPTSAIPHRFRPQSLPHPASATPMNPEPVFPTDSQLSSMSTSMGSINTSTPNATKQRSIHAELLSEFDPIQRDHSHWDLSGPKPLIPVNSTPLDPMNKFIPKLTSNNKTVRCTPDSDDPLGATLRKPDDDDEISSISDNGKRWAPWDRSTTSVTMGSRMKVDNSNHSGISTNNLDETEKTIIRAKNPIHMISPELPDTPRDLQTRNKPSDQKCTILKTENPRERDSQV